MYIRITSPAPNITYPKKRWRNLTLFKHYFYLLWSSLQARTFEPHCSNYWRNWKSLSKGTFRSFSQTGICTLIKTFKYKFVSGKPCVWAESTYNLQMFHCYLLKCLEITDCFLFRLSNFLHLLQVPLSCRPRGINSTFWRTERAMGTLSHSHTNATFILNSQNDKHNSRNIWLTPESHNEGQKVPK